MLQKNFQLLGSFSIHSFKIFAWAEITTGFRPNHQSRHNRAGKKNKKKKKKKKKRERIKKTRIFNFLDGFSRKKTYQPIKYL